MAWKGPAPKFRESLRLNNLYPTLPPTRFKEEKQPLYEQFKREMGALNSIGDAPALMGQTEYSPEYKPPTHPIDRNNLNVQFNEGNTSEYARGVANARTAHGVDLQRNALSPYQHGQLVNKDRDLDIREQNLRANQEFAGRRVAQTEEMNDFNQANPTGNNKVVEMADGNTYVLDRNGNPTRNLGPSGKLGDANKLAQTQTNALGLESARQTGRIGLEGVRQEGRMQSGTQQGEQRLAQIAATIAGKPIQTNSDMEYIRDAAGNVTEVKNRRRDILPPVGPQITGDVEQLMGPDGKLHTVPRDKVDDAITNYGMKRQPSNFGEVTKVKK